MISAAGRGREGESQVADENEARINGSNVACPRGESDSMDGMPPCATGDQGYRPDLSSNTVRSVSLASVSVVGHRTNCLGFEGFPWVRIVCDLEIAMEV